ncbi:hypothetical protein B0J14DRAFT_180624 [Halenospora varia]|nr:hypothetical protein B0J14DRAFT_180624 [Halenospora varia]
MNCSWKSNILLEVLLSLLFESTRSDSWCNEKFAYSRQVFIDFCVGHRRFAVGTWRRRHRKNPSPSLTAHRKRPVDQGVSTLTRAMPRLSKQDRIARRFPRLYHWVKCVPERMGNAYRP